MRIIKDESIAKTAKDIRYYDPYKEVWTPDHFIKSYSILEPSEKDNDKKKDKKKDTGKEEDVDMLAKARANLVHRTPELEREMETDIETETESEIDEIDEFENENPNENANENENVIDDQDQETSDGKKRVKPVEYESEYEYRFFKGIPSQLKDIKEINRDNFREVFTPILVEKTIAAFPPEPEEEAPLEILYSQYDLQGYKLEYSTLDFFGNKIIKTTDLSELKAEKVNSTINFTTKEGEGLFVIEVCFPPQNLLFGNF